jgi:myosin heavy subunit
MHIVDAMHLDRREVQLGNTKVFIKSPESVSFMLLERRAQYFLLARWKLICSDTIASFF